MLPVKSKMMLPYFALDKVAGRCCILTLLLLLLCLMPGCQTTPKTTYSTDLPAQHTVNSKYFVIHSNVRLDSDNVLVQELENVRERLFATLQLPEQRDPVNVYLFSNEASYRYYMNTTWQNLPPRRAYFVGTSRELAVYSFLGSNVQEDLRHEFTHGLLHASLRTVPLWLDEGLAEYFEVDPNLPGAVHAEHVNEWKNAKQEGWSPNLFKLEMLSDFRDMTQRDYAEAWGWVHYMLQTSDETAEVLLKYLASLESAKIAPRLMPQLDVAAPSNYNDLQTHVARMQDSPVAVKTR